MEHPLSNCYYEINLVLERSVIEFAQLPDPEPCRREPTVSASLAASGRLNPLPRGALARFLRRRPEKSRIPRRLTARDRPNDRPRDWPRSDVRTSKSYCARQDFGAFLPPHGEVGVTASVFHDFCGGPEERWSRSNGGNDKIFDPNRA